MDPEVISKFIFFGAIIAIFIIKGLFKGRKDKKMMKDGEPYLGLSIEWPKSHSGRVLFNGSTLLEFPLNTHNDNILYLNERHYEDNKLTYVIDDQSLLDSDELSFSVEFDQKADASPHPHGKLPELEFELMMLFIVNKDKYSRRELMEREIYLEQNGSHDIKFTGLQARLARYKQFYQNRSNSEQTTNSNGTVQR